MEKEGSQKSELLPGKSKSHGAYESDCRTFCQGIIFQGTWGRIKDLGLTPFLPSSQRLLLCFSMQKHTHTHKPTPKIKPTLNITIITKSNKNGTHLCIALCTFVQIFSHMRITCCRITNLSWVPGRGAKSLEFVR